MRLFSCLGHGSAFEQKRDRALALRSDRLLRSQSALAPRLTLGRAIGLILAARTQRNVLASERACRHLPIAVRQKPAVRETQRFAASL